MSRTCRWAGCTVQIGHSELRCPTHRKAYQSKVSGDDGSTRTNLDRLSDGELAEARRRMSRFENPASVARALGVTKSGLLRALAKRGAS